MTAWIPLVIIGAPRSGTNMLRDALCALPGLATWPCDEINAIWKHGHLPSGVHDDFTAAMATPKLCRFVAAHFERLARRTGASVVVEKTCANSVRAGYVRAVLPDARFVFIHRHGADAVASAIKRWSSPIDLDYTLRKVRFVPWSDVPMYGWRFLRIRVGQMLDTQRRMRVWGPMTEKVAAAARQGDVAAAAAWQWRECVERSMDELPAGCARVRYEDFVRDPMVGVRELVRMLGLEGVPDRAVETAVDDVRADLGGQGLNRLETLGVRERVAPIINPALSRLGYDTI